jgi:glycosyltransferase involved in cell wall biosynthesis
MIGDGELRGVCEDLIESLSLRKKVTMLGRQTPEQIQETINQSFLFVQHSVCAWDGDCEGTPVAVLEAGAAALPVVATKHAGIDDVVVDEETGMLVDERDVDGMANAIVAVSSDRQNARRMGQNGRVRVAEFFTLEKHLAHVAQVIRDARQKTSIKTRKVV